MLKKYLNRNNATVTEARKGRTLKEKAVHAAQQQLDELLTYESVEDLSYERTKFPHRWWSPEATKDGKHRVMKCYYDGMRFGNEEEKVENTLDSITKWIMEVRDTFEVLDDEVFTEIDKERDKVRGTKRYDSNGNLIQKEKEKKKKK